MWQKSDIYLDEVAINWIFYNSSVMENHCFYNKILGSAHSLLGLVMESFRVGLSIQCWECLLSPAQGKALSSSASASYRDYKVWCCCTGAHSVNGSHTEVSRILQIVYFIYHLKSTFNIYPNQEKIAISYKCYRFNHISWYECSWV